MNALLRSLLHISPELRDPAQFLAPMMDRLHIVGRKMVESQTPAEIAHAINSVEEDCDRIELLHQAIQSCIKPNSDGGEANEHILLALRNLLAVEQSSIQLVILLALRSERLTGGDMSSAHVALICRLLERVGRRLPVILVSALA